MASNGSSPERVRLGMTDLEVSPIAWTLANPAVDVTIVGAQRADHIEDSIAAADLDLSEGDLEEIDRITAGVSLTSGPSPEMAE